MQPAREFDRTPVPPEGLQPARHFASSYAGEHIAGTEFVIGAAFVAWGAAAKDVIFGLLLGNFLAVLTWRFVCAPIAVHSRLTLYALLAKLGGPIFVKMYSVVNGILFAILAGSMITVSASAVRIPLGISAQTQWYPTDVTFIAVALLVGAVVVTVSALGFRRLAQFASAVVPWMVMMFLVGALASVPVLAMHAGVSLPLSSLSDLIMIAETHVWVSSDSGLDFWHVAAFAWVANLAMHGGLGDMALLRFAKHANYGYFSAFGMFIGHFAAWIFAGVMGAAAGVVLNRSITEIDSGGVAYQALGISGIIAVIIAGWTTSNPTLYRAGLAFQSLNSSWSRVRVTIIVGIITTAISCFPFVFTKLLDFVGVMGLTLAPVGAIIIVEYWFFKHLGMARYWASHRQLLLNWAALLSWAAGLLVALGLSRFGLHLFFLVVPVWIATSVIYIVLARLFGAGQAYGGIAEKVESEIAERRAEERLFLDSPQPAPEASNVRKPLLAILRIMIFASLAACFFMAIQLILVPQEEFDAASESFKWMLLIPTVLFMVSGFGKAMAQAK